MKAAIKCEAIRFAISIQSFNPNCVCEYETTDIGNLGNVILTPEEAERYGINLFLIPDIGVSHMISLGEELRDWRLFSSHKRGQIIRIEDYLRLEPERKMIWINPRIRKRIEEWETQGYFLKNGEKISRESEPLMAIPLPTQEMSDELTLLRFQPQIPPCLMPVSKGVVADWNNAILLINGKKESVTLCNFIPIPMRREYEFDTFGNRKIFYVLRIVFRGFKRELRVEESDLSRLYPKIVDAVDAAVLYVAKGNTQLETFVRGCLPNMKELDITKLVDSGWQKVGTRMVYGLDSRQIPIPNWIFATGRTLLCENVTKETLWCYFTEIIEVSNDIKITAIMVLYMFLGLTYRLFEDAEVPLQFLLYVVGTTGSLKTSLCKAVFNIFNTNRQHNETIHTFTDTITSVEQYVCSLKDEVGIVDDLELGDSDSEARRQKEIFNEIVRLVGDTKGKNRSTPSLKAHKGRSARGLVAITGEQTLGKQSTRLRIVELEVTKGTIKGEKLSVFQDHPQRWSTVCASYLYYLELNYDAIVQKIAIRSRVLRRELKSKFSHLRTVDQLIAFQIIAEVLQDFWLQSIPNQVLVKNIVGEMVQAVEDVLLAASVEDEAQNPAVRYLADLDAMISQGEIKIAESMQLFFETKGFAGFYEYGDIFLLRDFSYEVVQNYENRMHRRFVFDMPKILKSLDELGAVYKFANGKTETFSNRKNGCVFIKIKGDFHKFLEN